MAILHCKGESGCAGCWRLPGFVCKVVNLTKKKTVLLVAFLAWCVSLHAQNKVHRAPNRPFSTSNRSVVIYTSADSGNLRLIKTRTASFSPLKQPLETQVCVF